ncbi:DUF6773 family protein [Paenibacillus borealis]|uniref:Uncharacterized protein n=1 Tax=Paenibacillus borealis TaxID=160799 RepID=A0A089LDL4_PAEBO|nr:DUF6773 family protein [Paenibacillus borealis]AIQ58897.1 hypothetical protein PBOR_19690 [Paenibacillus borealis]
MNRQGIKDERIITGFQKLNSHGFAICLAGLMISLAVKVFVLNWDMKLWLGTGMENTSASCKTNVISLYCN